MFAKFKDWLQEYWIILLCLLIGLLVVYFFAGCEPTTRSLLDPEIKVNRQNLISEFDLLMARFENKILDLDQQQRFRDFVLKQTLFIAESGTVNPIGILTALSGIIGIGFAGDDIRLRKQRKKYLRYEPVDSNKT